MRQKCVASCKPLTAMHLLLSRDSPGNTTITNSTGQVLYRSSTPFKWSGRTTTVSKVVPNESDGDHMRDRFAELAQIEWNGPKTSIFRYHGNQSFTKDFFKHEGKGGRRRYFTASDGSSYMWILGVYVASLEVNDLTRTLIARSHRHHLGLIGKARKAYIEILPEGEHILDDIVVTWVFAEIVRRRKEAEHMR